MGEVAKADIDLQAAQALHGKRAVHRDIDRILFDRHRIADRVHELGMEIREDFERIDHDVEIVLVPIMTGAIIFVADLIRHLPHKIRISVLTASSYHGRTTKSSGKPVLGMIPETLQGKHVLIVDDILDSGTTIRRIRAEIDECRPKGVKSCVLLRKTIPSALATPCEFVGFDIPDVFVVGYGLDYDDYYRNLPDIGVLKPEAL